jgi:hypothetical protein
VLCLRCMLPAPTTAEPARWEKPTYLFWSVLSAFIMSCIVVGVGVTQKIVGNLSIEHDTLYVSLILLTPYTLALLTALLQVQKHRVVRTVGKSLLMLVTALFVAFLVDMALYALHLFDGWFPPAITLTLFLFVPATLGHITGVISKSISHVTLFKRFILGSAVCYVLYSLVASGAGLYDTTLYTNMRTDGVPATPDTMTYAQCTSYRNSLFSTHVLALPYREIINVQTVRLCIEEVCRSATNPAEAEKACTSSYVTGGLRSGNNFELIEHPAETEPTPPITPTPATPEAVATPPILNTPDTSLVPETPTKRESIPPLAKVPTATSTPEEVLTPNVCRELSETACNQTPACVGAYGPSYCGSADEYGDVLCTDDESYQGCETLSKNTLSNIQLSTSDIVLPPTTYITTQEWPPYFYSDGLMYPVCKEDASQPLDPAIQTTLRTHNDREYCISIQTETNMGSDYLTYVYTTEGAKLWFTLRSPKCDFYVGVQKEECEAERTAFELDSHIFSFFERER